MKQPITTQEGDGNYACAYVYDQCKLSFVCLNTQKRILEKSVSRPSLLSLTRFPSLCIICKSGVNITNPKLKDFVFNNILNKRIILIVNSC